MISNININTLNSLNLLFMRSVLKLEYFIKTIITVIDFHFTIYISIMDHFNSRAFLYANENGGVFFWTFSHS